MIREKVKEFSRILGIKEFAKIACSFTSSEIKEFARLLGIFVVLVIALGAYGTLLILFSTSEDGVFTWSEFFRIFVGIIPIIAHEMGDDDIVETELYPTPNPP